MTARLVCLCHRDSTTDFAGRKLLWTKSYQNLTKGIFDNKVDAPFALGSDSIFLFRNLLPISAEEYNFVQKYVILVLGIALERMFSSNSMNSIPEEAQTKNPEASE